MCTGIDTSWIQRKCEVVDMELTSPTPDKPTPEKLHSEQVFLKSFELTGGGWAEFDEDGTVHVKGGGAINTMLRPAKVKQIPIPFGTCVGSFSCGQNDLQDLTHSPTQLTGSFFVSYNPNLQSLKGAPSYVGRDFDMQHVVPANHSLRDMPRHVGGFLRLKYDPDLGALMLCNVQGNPKLDVKYERGQVHQMLQFASIMQRYIGKGWAAMVPCARELIRAGLKGNATL